MLAGLKLQADSNRINSLSYSLDRREKQTVLVCHASSIDSEVIFVTLRPYLEAKFSVLQLIYPSMCLFGAAATSTSRLELHHVLGRWANSKIILQGKQSFARQAEASLSMEARD
eukprot:5297269-Pleurochrysis_carterae.AAC.1